MSFKAFKGSEQPDLAVDVSVHCWGFGLVDLELFLSTQKTL